ncbi:Uncharacterised protein [Serratia quinivorans]|uniref:hypothetical protein n=1 Tax=Serratia quinivorans TaxID=137545 RepID=UPI0021786804|nr:hypothetical protein [Serratia quinivorans]CAI2019398.1 Uncharacterised protein [Serratia quinivorans]
MHDNNALSNTALFSNALNRIREQLKQASAAAHELEKSNQSNKAEEELIGILDRYKAFIDGVEATEEETEEDPAPKYKSRGIALCHESQGYSANKRPNSLLMKSNGKSEGKVKVVVSKSTNLRTAPALKGAK